MGARSASIGKHPQHAGRLGNDEREVAAGHRPKTASLAPSQHFDIVDAVTAGQHLPH